MKTKLSDLNKKQLAGVKAFVGLIKLYESITTAQITTVWNAIDKNGKEVLQAVRVANKLTGFSSISQCKLCVAVGHNKVWACQHCFWRVATKDSCLFGKNSATYHEIFNATTIADLKKAFKNRALYMRETLKSQFTLKTIKELFDENT